MKRNGWRPSEAGWNTLVGVEPDTILDAWRNFVPPVTRPAIFGEGYAGEKIAEIISRADVVFGQRLELAHVYSYRTTHLIGQHHECCNYRWGDHGYQPGILSFQAGCEG